MTTAYDARDEDRARYADDDGPELEGLYIARDRHDAVTLLINEARVKAAWELMLAFAEIISGIQGSADMREAILNLTCEPDTDAVQLVRALEEIQAGIRESKECYFLESLPEDAARTIASMRKVALLASEIADMGRECPV